MPDLHLLYDAVLGGKDKTARSVTEEALAAGVEPLKLVQEYMVPAMAEVGRRFESNEYFVPELLLSARAMKAALELIRPLLAASGAQPVGRVAIGTVKGDLHDIGKNLVGMMAEGAGFTVVDLGTDTSAERFIAAVREHLSQNEAWVLQYVSCGDPENFLTEAPGDVVPPCGAVLSVAARLGSTRLIDNVVLR